MHPAETKGCEEHQSSPNDKTTTKEESSSEERSTKKVNGREIGCEDTDSKEEEISEGTVPWRLFP